MGKFVSLQNYRDDAVLAISRVSPTVKEFCEILKDIGEDDKSIQELAKALEPVDDLKKLPEAVGSILTTGELKSGVKYNPDKANKYWNGKGELQYPASRQVLLDWAGYYSDLKERRAAKQDLIVWLGEFDEIWNKFQKELHLGKFEVSKEIKNVQSANAYVWSDLEKIKRVRGDFEEESKEDIEFAEKRAKELGISKYDEDFKKLRAMLK